MFDIVIPVGPNDLSVIKNNTSYTQKNIIGFRNIFLISCIDTLQVDGCITISESIFPFKMKDLEDRFGKNSRNGWYLQQLLKLYAGNIIPGILDKYLVIDADTCFIKPTNFITDDGKCSYNTGTEYHIPYFEHMNRLHPSLKKVCPFSGISHHMLFEVKIINQLFKLVEDYHGNNKLFWEIFLDNTDRTHGSSASEYEIYFTYIYLYNLGNIVIRELKWVNINIKDFDNIIKTSDFDFVSVHWYLRL